MSTSFSPSQVEELRRTAKKLARRESIPHHLALDCIAGQHGFRNWSLLSKHSAPTLPSQPRASIPPASPPATAAAGPDPRRRYYLHGDQYEGDVARYYCASCDVFFEAQHFATHGPHTGERLLDSLERWNKRDWRSQLNYRRPDNATNILEAQAVSARAEYNRLRPAFSTWLWRQCKRHDRIGLMAVGLLSPRGLPTTPKSLPELYQHYERYGKSYHGLDALYDAWDEFKAQLPGETGSSPPQGPHLR